MNQTTSPTRFWIARKLVKIAILVGGKLWYQTLLPQVMEPA